MAILLETDKPEPVDPKVIEQKQEQWREKYIYPLQKMFSGSGIFFTTNVFGMDRELSNAAEQKGKMIGNFSVAQRMTEFVSPEATSLYRAMLADPFPYRFNPSPLQARKTKRIRQDKKRDTGIPPKAMMTLGFGGSSFPIAGGGQG